MARIVILTLVVQVLFLGTLKSGAASIVQFQQSASLSTSDIVTAIKSATSYYIDAVGGDDCEHVKEVFESAGQVNIDGAVLRLMPAANTGLFRIVPTGGDPIPLQSLTHNCNTLRSQVNTESYGDQTVVPAVLELSGTSLSLVIQLPDPTSLVVTFTGAWTIAGFRTVDVEAEYTQSTNELEITVPSGTNIAISSLLSQFNAELVPSELNSVADNLPILQFSIRNLRIAYPFTSDPRQIRFGGAPAVAGYTILHMDAVIVRDTQLRTYLVVGFDFGRIGLVDIFRTVSGFDLGGIVILDQEAEVAVTIAPVTLPPPTTLIGGRLDGIAIRKGIAVVAQIGLPDGCSDDLLCSVVQLILGDNVRLTLRGTLESATRFFVFVGVNDLQIGPGLTLASAGYEVIVGSENSFGIVGSMAIPGTDITVAVRLGVTPMGVVMEMTLAGCWNNAFGVNWLAICNILGSIGFVPGVAVTAFEVGAEIELGDRSCSTPIMASGFFGVNAGNPSDNYYYVSFGPATISSIIASLCVRINLPRPLAESGFPNGFLSSFSLLGKELPHAGISIPAGYRLKGTLNILGLEGSADVTIGLPEAIDIGVNLPPINVGDGLLEMYESQNSRSRGPFLRADIDIVPLPRVDIAASGYVNVLGIAVEASLLITNEKYEFSISGNMLNLFMADLTISAAYGNIIQASYQVRGFFRNDLYEVIENEIERVLDAARNEASNAFSSAQRDVDDASDDVEQARAELDSARAAVDSAQDDLRAAENALADERDRNICSIRNCGTTRVCIPCRIGTRCCRRIAGTCVFRCPRIGDCCDRVPDPVCESENAACQVIREAYDAAVRAAQGVVNTASSSLNSANVAFAVAEQAFNAANGVLQAAQTTLQGVNQLYAAGLKAVEFISSYGLNGLISIQEMSFDVNLSVANGGQFAGSVRATVLTTLDINVSIDINLRDITAMARQLAGYIDNSFSSLF